MKTSLILVAALASGVPALAPAKGGAGHGPRGAGLHRTHPASQPFVGSARRSGTYPPSSGAAGPDAAMTDERSGRNGVDPHAGRAGARSNPEGG